MLIKREKLAQSQLLWEEQQELKNIRKNRLVNDLQSESSAWITSADQIDSRITEDLFSKEAGSTGYVTKYSNLWKYQVFTPKLKRLLSDDFQEKLQNSTAMMDRLKAKGQYRIAKRVVVEDFLDQIIGTGAERANFKGLVSDISSSFEKLEGFDEIKQFYEDDESSNNNGNNSQQSI